MLRSSGAASNVVVGKSPKFDDRSGVVQFVPEKGTIVVLDADEISVGGKL